jgi:hypothetical protein
VLALVELLVQLGGLALLANLFALVAAALGLGHALFGLDVSLVSAFTSPDNPWTLLVLGCVTMLTFEPLRAAVSAQAFVEARTRRDGADLHEAVDLAIGSGGARDRTRLAGSGLTLGLALIVAGTAYAVPTSVRAQADDAVRARVARILSQDEFQEHAGGEQPLSRWFERLGAWLETLGVEERDRSAAVPRGGLAGELTAWGAIGVLALLLAALAYLLRSPVRTRATSIGAELRGDEEGSGISAGAKPSSVDHDDVRSALRALYLGTLVALDRAGRLELDPAKTNGQHLRALPSGPSHRALAELTQLFDRTWYGRAIATSDDLARGRALAESALRTPGEPAEPAGPGS